MKDEDAENHKFSKKAALLRNFLVVLGFAFTAVGTLFILGLYQQAIPSTSKDILYRAEYFTDGASIVFFGVLLLALAITANLNVRFHRYRETIHVILKKHGLLDQE